MSNRNWSCISISYHCTKMTPLKSVSCHFALISLAAGPGSAYAHGHTPNHNQRLQHTDHVKRLFQKNFVFSFWAEEAGPIPALRSATIKWSRCFGCTFWCPSLCTVYGELLTSLGLLTLLLLRSWDRRVFVYKVPTTNLHVSVLMTAMILVASRISV